MQNSDWTILFFGQKVCVLVCTLCGAMVALWWSREACIVYLMSFKVDPFDMYVNNIYVNESVGPFTQLKMTKRADENCNGLTFSL